jgi:hypothetical protein
MVEGTAAVLYQLNHGVMTVSQRLQNCHTRKCLFLQGCIEQFKEENAPFLLDQKG